MKRGRGSRRERGEREGGEDSTPHTCAGVSYPCRGHLAEVGPTGKLQVAVVEVEQTFLFRCVWQPRLLSD